MEEKKEIEEINHIIVLSTLIIDKMERLESSSFPKFKLKKVSKMYIRELEKYIDTMADLGKYQDAENYKKELNKIGDYMEKVENVLSN